MGLASDQYEYPFSFSCEIKILQARNLELKCCGNIFVRYYLSAGNNERVKLQTREISSKSDLLWNDSFSLECMGTQDFFNNSLKEESVVFELWSRKTNPILGKFGGPKLMGRAQIPWKKILESPKMEMEKWVVMVPKKKSCINILPDDGTKPPSVRIAMRVRVAEMVEMEKKKKKKSTNRRLKDGCGCCKDSTCKCEDYEIFALVGAFEAL